MVASFKPEGELETPYARARQVWDERLGSARQQAFNWRMVSFALIGLVLVLSLSLAYVGSQSKLVPYVVEVEPTNINVRGVAEEYKYSPTPVVERYFVTNFVNSVRTLSSDPVINREKLISAYALLTKRSFELLKEIHQKNDPMLESQIKTRSIEIETLIHLGEKSYQVDWIELEYDKSGTRTNIQNFRGVFTLVHKTPTNDDQTKQNPLGIYVDHFSWQTRRV